MAINDERPFMCPEPGCFLRFKRKFTMAEHRKTHTGEKPFTCPVRSCGKCFTTTGNLSRHKRLHSWLKPHVCTVAGCGKEFLSELKFKRHMKTHFRAPNDRHYCTVENCGKSFTTLGNLTRHVKHRHRNMTMGRSVCRPPGADAQIHVHAATNSAQRPAVFDPSVPVSEYVAVFDPLMGETSNVSDDELLDVLQCLFDVGLE